MTRVRTAFVAVAVAAALSLAACGGGGGDKPTPTSGATGGGGGAAVDKARQQLCSDILLIQSGFRPDAMTRFITRLKIDRAAFVSAGDTADAAKVVALQAAAVKLRHALLTQKGVDQGQHALQKAVDKLSC
jgi:hypothetical protein